MDIVLIEMVQASLRVCISLQPDLEFIVMNRLVDLLPDVLAPTLFVWSQIHAMPPFCFSSGPTSTDQIWLNSTIVVTHYVNERLNLGIMSMIPSVITKKLRICMLLAGLT